MAYGYVYYSRNEIDGTMYIGKITSRQLYYWPDYKGSGVELQKAFKKFGRENFSVHFLAAAEDGEELTWLEKYYLKHYNIPNENFYNVNLATSNSEQSTYFNKNNRQGINLKNIICFNIKDYSQQVFNNITDFCRVNNFSRGCLFNVLSGQRVTHKDCIFWYEDFPVSGDAINWILNYKNKTNYKTKYVKIDEVKEEFNRMYKAASNKDREFSFHGYLIESGDEIEMDWHEIGLHHYYLVDQEGKTPIEAHSIENLKVDTTVDDKFEKERECEYILTGENKTLYFNYDEINNLTKLYPDISPRLLRQAINRSQKTVMNKKYSLKKFEGK